MKTKFMALLIAFAASISVFLASCSSKENTQRLQVTGTLQPGSPQASSNDINSQLLKEINQHRSAIGKSALKRHAGLDRLAHQHSVYLMQNRGKFGLYGKNVSHFGAENRHLYARQAYNMENMSENVASCPAGPQLAARIMQLWKNSPDHIQSIEEDWTYCGVAVVTSSDGTAFATQLMATGTQSHMLMRERFSGF